MRIFQIFHYISKVCSFCFTRLFAGFSARSALYRKAQSFFLRNERRIPRAYSFRSRGYHFFAVGKRSYSAGGLDAAAPQHRIVHKAHILLLGAALRHSRGGFYILRAGLRRFAAGGGYLLLVFKALGVCLLTQFSADACLDAGEKALASRVEFAGRIAVVLLALPLFEEIAEAVLSLTGASK